MPPSVLSTVAVLLLFVASFSMKTSVDLSTLTLIQCCCAAGQRSVVGRAENLRVVARTGQSGLRIKLRTSRMKSQSPVLSLQSDSR